MLQKKLRRQQYQAWTFMDFQSDRYSNASIIAASIERAKCNLCQFCHSQVNTEAVHSELTFIVC